MLCVWQCKRKADELRRRLQLRRQIKPMEHSACPGLRHYSITVEIWNSVNTFRVRERLTRSVSTPHWPCFICSGTRCTPCPTTVLQEVAIRSVLQVLIFQNNSCLCVQNEEKEINSNYISDILKISLRIVDKCCVKTLFLSDEASCDELLRCCEYV